jgi:hypothetical protein
VLVKGSPIKIIEALNLAAATFKTIRQTLFPAFFLPSRRFRWRR